MSTLSTSAQPTFNLDNSNDTPDITETNKLVDDLINELSDTFTQMNQNAFQQLEQLRFPASSYFTHPLDSFSSSPSSPISKETRNSPGMIHDSSSSHPSPSLSMPPNTPLHSDLLIDPIAINQSNEDYLASSNYSFVTSQWKHHPPVDSKQVLLSSIEAKPILHETSFDPLTLNSSSPISSPPPLTSGIPLPTQAASAISPGVSFQDSYHFLQDTSHNHSFKPDSIAFQSSQIQSPMKFNSTSPTFLLHPTVDANTHPPSISSPFTPFPPLDPHLSVSSPIETSLSPIPKLLHQLNSSSPTTPSAPSTHVQGIPSSSSSSSKDVSEFKEKIQRLTKELHWTQSEHLELHAQFDSLKETCLLYQTQLNEKNQLILDLQQRMKSLEQVIQEQQSVGPSFRSVQHHDANVQTNEGHSSWDTKKREKLKKKVQEYIEQRLTHLVAQEQSIPFLNSFKFQSPTSKKLHSSHRSTIPTHTKMHTQSPQSSSSSSSSSSSFKASKEPPSTTSTMMPFVVGTNTGKSHSLPVNLQKMMAMVQKHRHCDICVDEPSPKAMVAAHLESEHKRLEKEYTKLRKQYSEALQVYDGATLENKVLMHGVLKELANVMAKKAEELAELTEKKSKGLATCSHVTPFSSSHGSKKKETKKPSGSKNLGLLRSSQRVQSVLQSGKGK